MTTRTDTDPRQAVRRMIADALLSTINAAIRNGAEPDCATAALLATFINVSVDLVPPRQVANELRRMADEVDQLTDNPTERPN